MTEMQKLYRVFQLIRILNTPPGKTVKQLINILNSSKSDIYRLLNLLEELGYPVETDFQHRKFLQLPFSKQDKSTLDPEELFYLQEVLQQHTGGSSLAASILHKFDQNLNLIPLADSLPQLHITRMQKLAKAGIDMRKCLKIHRYRSLTGDDVRDRWVEPLEITQDGKYLIAWDKEVDDQRQFKIIRIQDIDILEEKVTPNRIASPMDIFGLTGEEWLSVRMELSSLAHHLIVEEFPYCTQFIRKTNDRILFDGMVRNWKGIGRFVLGLPGEVKVLSPDKFKNHLKKRVNTFYDSL